MLCKRPGFWPPSAAPASDAPDPSPTSPLVPCGVGCSAARLPLPSPTPSVLWRSVCESDAVMLGPRSVCGLPSPERGSDVQLAHDQNSAARRVGSAALGATRSSMSPAEESVRTWITQLQQIKEQPNRTSASKRGPAEAEAHATTAPPPRPPPPTDAPALCSPISAACSGRRPVSSALSSRSAGSKYATPVLAAVEVEGGESPPGGLMQDLLDEFARNVVHELEGADMLDEVCGSLCISLYHIYPFFYGYMYINRIH